MKRLFSVPRAARYAALGVAATGLGVAFVRDHGSAGAGMAVGVGLAVGQSLPLSVLDRYPLWVFGISEAANAAYGALGYPSSPVSFSPYLALAVLASRCRWAALSALAAAMGVVVLMGWLRPEHVMAVDYLANLVVVLVFFVGGREQGSWRRRHALSIERLRTTADLEAAAVERTRLDERLEMARELHDTLGHALAVVRLEAQLANKAIEDDPGLARQSLEVADRRASDALNQVQTLLGRLEVAAPLCGQCARSDLEALVAGVRSAGVRVSLVEQGAARTLAPLASHALYQVVQEALTNVLRHAGAEHAWVVVSWGNSGVRLRVTDDGAGGAVQPGRGLVGMTERVELLGGQLRIGPCAEGGLMVEADLPLPWDVGPG